jgi:ribosomal protein S19
MEKIEKYTKDQRDSKNDKKSKPETQSQTQQKNQYKRLENFQRVLGVARVVLGKKNKTMKNGLLDKTASKIHIKKCSNPLKKSSKKGPKIKTKSTKKKTHKKNTVPCKYKRVNEIISKKKLDQGTKSSSKPLIVSNSGVKAEVKIKTTDGHKESAIKSNKEEGSGKFITEEQIPQKDIDHLAMLKRRYHPMYFIKVKEKKPTKAEIKAKTKEAAKKRKEKKVFKWARRGVLERRESLRLYGEDRTPANFYEARNRPKIDLEKRLEERKKKREEQRLKKISEPPKIIRMIQKKRSRKALYKFLLQKYRRKIEINNRRSRKGGRSTKIRKRGKYIKVGSKPFGVARGWSRPDPFSMGTVYKRDIIITAADVGRRVSIYNGNRFFTVSPTRPMIGTKFGEYCFPKQWKGGNIHRGNKTDIKKKKKTSALKGKKKGKVGKKIVSRPKKTKK